MIDDRPRWESEDFDDFDSDVEADCDGDDCGLMPDGQCMLAGTEWCDWECGRLH